MRGFVDAFFAYGRLPLRVRGEGEKMRPSSATAPPLNNNTSLWAATKVSSRRDVCPPVGHDDDDDVTSNTSYGRKKGNTEMHFSVRH